MARLFMFLKVLWSCTALVLLCVSVGHAEVLTMSLQDAESQALSTSDTLKSFIASEHAAGDSANAQRTSLLVPKLSLQGSYTYYGTIPEVSFTPQSPAIPFGTHNTYSVGPMLTYTLWDSFAGAKSYHSSQKLSEARKEDRKNAKLQLLFELRATYVATQLGLEELRLIDESLKLARAQEKDVQNRMRAGAAARIDLVTAKRSVLNYEAQFKQSQAALTASLKDLLSLTGTSPVSGAFRPGPEGVPGVNPTLRLDSLANMLEQEQRTKRKSPDDKQPQVRGKLLEAESYHLAAESQSRHKYPTVQISGGVSYMVPNVPNPPEFWQQTAGVTLSMPLLLGDPSSSLSAQQNNLAMAAEYRAGQSRRDLLRDFTKAEAELESLKERRELAIRDVAQSKEAARLYYQSYQAGRFNLIDVQNANLQALVSQVSAARIDAQILNQLFLLKSISADEVLSE